MKQTALGYFSRYKLVSTVGLGLLFLSIYVTPVLAANVSQAYHSGKPLALGAIVSIKSNGSDIEETSLDNESAMVGVVVGSDESVIDVQPSGTDTRVASSGEVSLLVSNVNGDIKAGDNLIISPLNGVAGKDLTETKAKRYVAIASEDFDVNGSNTKQVTIDYNDGKSNEVEIGIISAKMNLINRPDDANVKKDNFFVALISKIIGKPVDKTQLLAATAVFVTTFIVTGFMLQGSIRGSFVALGRNPLSKSVIISNLFKIVAIGLLILEVGAAAAYVILVL